MELVTKRDMRDARMLIASILNNNDLDWDYTYP